MSNRNQITGEWHQMSLFDVADDVFRDLRAPGKDRQRDALLIPMVPDVRTKPRRFRGARPPGKPRFIFQAFGRNGHKSS